jgi:3-dehydroquinate synthase
VSLTRIGVTADRGYDVLIGRDLAGELPGLIGSGTRRVLLVHQRVLAGSAERIRAELTGVGYEVHLSEVPDAEEAKTATVAARCWEQLGLAGFTRDDVVIGLGGGAATDLAGFVAATWLRGVRVIQMPTTLLGMVDAAVGGKTGINTAEGKNLVGAFHSPIGVLCDLDTLDTLPAADLAAGLAEVVKCGFIDDPRILELVEADPDAARDPSAPVVRELVERAVATKARVVSADLREADLREILNYGHTRSNTTSTSAGGTGRRSRWAWCSPRNSPVSPATWMQASPSGTAGSSPRSACPPAIRPGAGRSCSPRCAGTRRPGVRRYGS